MTPEEDTTWIPAEIEAGASGPVVVWRHLGPLRFTHPFFRETLQAAGDAPTCRTPLARLEELAAATPGLPPAGFIFHLSRCGSTLVTQMLAALHRHSVLSEPSPVNHLLWPETPLGHEELTADRLRWLLALLGRRWFPEEEALFVKFDAWHTLDLPLIRRAFPDVPWVFVYRDPVEILVSHVWSAGRHTIPGTLDPERLGVGPPRWTEEGLRTHAAQVLARIAGAALEHLDGHGRLLHYHELPGALPGILRHFKTRADAREIATMLAVAARHSKEPGRSFTPDSALRQAQASPELRRIAETITGEVYQALEARRHAQPAW